jgi:hypothetical protein
MTVWVARASKNPIVVRLSIPIPLEGATVLDQVVWTVALTAIVFLFWRFLAQYSLARAFLRTLAGVFALAGFPLVALRFPTLFFQASAFEYRFAIGSSWLFCEIAMVLLCAVLYYLGKWPVPDAVSIVLLVLHFCF